MTQAQKIAKEKFKKAIAYRKKTGATLKEAFAFVYGRKVSPVKKKAAPKKKAAIKKKSGPKKVAAIKIIEKGESKSTKAKATYQQVRTKKGTYKGLKKISGLHNKIVVSGIKKGINKSMLGLLKEYIAVYNFANGSSDYEMFKATSLAEAKKFAQFHKRRENIKGKVSVKLIKK